MDDMAKHRRSAWRSESFEYAAARRDGDSIHADPAMSCAPPALHELLQFLTTALGRSEPSVFMVIGESGSGKTTLLRALGATLSTRDQAVVLHRCAADHARRSADLGRIAHDEDARSIYLIDGAEAWDGEAVAWMERLLAAAVAKGFRARIVISGRAEAEAQLSRIIGPVLASNAAFTRLQLDPVPADRGDAFTRHRQRQSDVPARAGQRRSAPPRGARAKRIRLAATTALMLAVAAAPVWMFHPSREISAEMPTRAAAAQPAMPAPFVAPIAEAEFVPDTDAGAVVAAGALDAESEHVETLSDPPTPNALTMPGLDDFVGIVGPAVEAATRSIPIAEAAAAEHERMAAGAAEIASIAQTAIDIDTDEVMRSIVAAAPPIPATIRSTRPSGLTAMQITVLHRRGDEFLRTGDIAAARLFYERAANAGDIDAMTALARTYDSRTLRQLGVVGLTPDAERALHWYHRAAETRRRVGE